MKHKQMVYGLALILAMFVTGCFEWGSFTSIGQGFQYGFVVAPQGASIYYNDTGIIEGYCYKVCWNDTLAVIFNHPNIRGEIRKDVIEYYLLDKTLEKDAARIHFYPGLIGPLKWSEVFEDRKIEMAMFPECKSY